MVDRNYLPYKSAREYIDRGMAKWMGFFISEHISASSKYEALDESQIEEPLVYFHIINEES